MHLPCLVHGIHSRSHIELNVYISKMPLYSPLGYIEAIRDLRVTAALRHEGEYLAFAGGKRVPAWFA